MLPTNWQLLLNSERRKNILFKFKVFSIKKKYKFWVPNQLFHGLYFYLLINTPLKIFVF